jgi:four helix bundle protein
MDLEELQVYNLAMELGDKVWNIVEKWNYFEKDTVGKQLIRACDSVASNISEGYGRFFFKDTINFLYYSRGSLFETRTWLTKAHNRSLIKTEDYEDLLTLIKNLGVKLNNYISTIKHQNPKK